MNNPFRRPNEMKADAEERVPVSARIRKSTKLLLERESKKAGLSLAEVVSNTLEDYAQWLNDGPNRKRGRN